MRKIMSLFFMIVLLLGLVSCKEQKEVEPSLLEKVEEKIDGSFYSCFEGTMLLKTYLHHYYLDQYVPYECVIVRRKDQDYRYGGVWIYSFEKDTNVDALKNHLVSHTIPNDNKYAVSDNLLFITRQETNSIRYLIKIFSLVFETGQLDFNDALKTEKNCIGISKQKELSDTNDFKVFKSYDEFLFFKEKLLKSKTDENVYEYDAKNLEILKTFNASDFEERNLLFLQISKDIPFNTNGYEASLSPVLRLSEKDLDVCNLVKINPLNNFQNGYIFYLCFIDKNISFSQVKYSFYDCRTELNYLFN